MTRTRYNIHLCVSGIFFVTSIFNLVNVYLDLGYFGHSAKGIMITTFLVGLAYLTWFGPTKRDVEERSPFRTTKTGN